MMPHPSISPADSHRLRAAEGWLELNNPKEANAELESISPENQALPEVLKLRWEVSAAARDWEAAADVAAILIQQAPEDVQGWLNRSYALHELRQTAEARDSLLRVVDKFPACATLRYNLACYESQLGRLEQARSWLEKAFELGEAKELKLAALQDPDLEPLWKGLGSL